MGATVSRLVKRFKSAEPTVPATQRCNFCNVEFEKRWYRCMSCFSFRLCPLCYDKKLCCGGVPTHYHWHPIQLVLSHKELFHQGESRYVAPFVRIYTCPHCAETGFSYYSIKDHLKEHRGDVKYVNCPICLSLPDQEEDTTVYSDLLDHIVNQHLEGKREINDGTRYY